MKYTLVETQAPTHPEAKYLAPRMWYSLTVDGCTVGAPARDFDSKRHAAFSLAHSAATITGKDIDGRDVKWE